MVDRAVSCYKRNRDPREPLRPHGDRRGMKILAVSPSCLMYSKIFLRLEPLGIELVAAAARVAGHDVRVLDLQVEPVERYHRLIREWEPEAIALSCNYLANVPEVIELAKAAAAIRPSAFVFAGGHSASFVARDLLEHSEGSIACVLKGEAESSVAALLECAARATCAGWPRCPAWSRLRVTGRPRIRKEPG